MALTIMTINEVKAAYIKAKLNYEETLRTYSRSSQSRQTRFDAYDELKMAEIHLADVSIDKIEAATGENLSDQLAAIIRDPMARSEAAEKVFLYLV